MDSTTIYLFFVFICLGAFAGGLIERYLNKRKAKAAPPPVADAGTQPALDAGQPKAAPNQLAGEGDFEILRAWRTKAGKVWLEMDGTRLDDKGKLQADQRRRLLNLVVDLRPWLETAAEAAPGRATQPQIRATAVSPTTPVAAAALADPAIPVIDDGKPKINMKSIVQQIDDVLQAKLAPTVFAQKDIHLVEIPGGGVAVQIEREKYGGVDAVPDPEIQALIRQAVADWDKGQK
jgi:hypothetical protein